MRAYEYRHTVGLEETNVVGNVYFAHYVSWQGRCRELFLRDHAPAVLDELRHDLRLVTTRVSCDYFAELVALDEVVVQMTLLGVTQNRVAMGFDYMRGGELVARGEQEVACLRAVDGTHVAAPVPAPLRAALVPYQEVDT
jgi:enediyne biosynthesis thioesterase